jgi:hypothetical protein
MRRSEHRPVDQVVHLAGKLTDMVLKEILDGNATYEDACLAVGITPSLLEAASQDLPGRCFSDLMIACTRSALEKADQKTKIRTRAANTRGASS